MSSTGLGCVGGVGDELQVRLYSACFASICQCNLCINARITKSQNKHLAGSGPPLPPLPHGVFSSPAPHQQSPIKSVNCKSLSHNLGRRPNGRRAGAALIGKV